MPVLTAEVLSWSASDIALALALNGTAAAIMSPYLGRLSDYIGRVWVIAAGLAILALEAFVVYLHPGTPLTLLALTLGGAGAPAYFNALYSLEGDVTRPQERGALTGFVGSFGEWGSIIGSSLVTPLVWKSFGIDAPMAVDAIVLTAGLVFALAMKSVLERQVGGQRLRFPDENR
jgi:predicted MFS family arabinose efflux permease